MMSKVNCWICDEEHEIDKLVTHLRRHTDAEAKASLKKQLKQEKK